MSWIPLGPRPRPAWQVLVDMAENGWGAFVRRETIATLRRELFEGLGLPLPVIDEEHGWCRLQLPGIRVGCRQEHLPAGIVVLACEAAPGAQVELMACATLSLAQGHVWVLR